MQETAVFQPAASPHGKGPKPESSAYEDYPICGANNTRAVHNAKAHFNKVSLWVALVGFPKATATATGQGLWVTGYSFHSSLGSTGETWNISHLMITASPRNQNHPSELPVEIKGV